MVTLIEKDHSHWASQKVLNAEIHRNLSAIVFLRGITKRMEPKGSLGGRGLSFREIRFSKMFCNCSSYANGKAENHFHFREVATGNFCSDWPYSAEVLEQTS